jgi:uncharacterized tellurite resistance protein B-like protein
MIKTLREWFDLESDLISKQPDKMLVISKLMYGMIAMDGGIDEHEKREVAALMNHRFGLSQDESETLIQQLSEEQHNFENTIRQANDLFSSEEKLSLVKDIWRIAAADGEIDFREDRYLNRVSMLFDLSATELNDIKESGKDLKWTEPGRPG